MSGDGLPTPYAEAVLDVVAAIPRGKVMSYSDVAVAVGRGGPRQVGQALSRFGSGVPWWRVLRADGTCAPLLENEQRVRLAKERTPLNGDVVDLERARWRPDSAGTGSVGTG